MMGGYIQKLKVVLIAFYFRRSIYLKAHFRENAVNLPQNKGLDMQASPCWLTTGERHVKAFILQVCIQVCLFDHAFFYLKLFF